MADPTAPVEFVDPSGAGGPYGDGTWPFSVARTDDGNGWHLGLQTLSSENHNYRNPTHPFPFSIDLFPFDGGLGPGKAYAPRSYVPSTAGATVYKDMVLGPLQRVGITLTSSSAQGTRAVSWNSALWILCGTEVCKIDSALVVSANRALGAMGTWLSVVGGELFVSMGQAGFIQKQTTAGAWSTSADVRAFSIEVVRNLVWRLGGAASGVDNSMSSITAIGANVATNAMTVANYNTAAGYKAGDASYQGSFIIDYGGVPWVGRPDGMFAPDPETKFVNQTPQLGAAPHAQNCIGAFTAKGYLWVPTVKGLLRCERGVSRRVGPETTDTPTINWWVRGGVEFDDSIYLLAEDYGTVNGTMYILQMQEDPHGISTGEYIYHLRGVATASLANAGRFITLFTNPTNPTLVYGGGSLVTSANRVSLSRGSGREYSDGSVSFEPGALDTGPFLFSPVETCFMALFVGVEGAAYVPASSSLSFSYSVDQYNPAAAPSTAMLSEQETGGGVQAISASGRFRRYAARGAYGHIGEVLCTFGGTGKAILKDLRAFGWLIPGPTDLFTVKLILGDLDETFHNTGPGIGAFDQLLALRAWKRDGTVLLGRIEDYETGHNDRFIISSVAAEATAATLAGGETHRFVLTATVAFARIDYQNLYAT